MPSESPAVAAVRRLAELPGIPEQVEAAREACTRLRWHQALRRRVPEAAAESRVRVSVTPKVSLETGVGETLDWYRAWWEREGGAR